MLSSREERLAQYMNVALVIDSLGTVPKPSRASGPCRHFSWVITSARCATLGSTRNGPRVSQQHRRLVKSAGDSAQPQEPPPASLPPPRLAELPEGHRLETLRGRRWPGPARGPPGLSQPSGAEPSRAPRGGAGSAIFLGARARAVPRRAAAAPAPRTYRWSPISP